MGTYGRISCEYLEICIYIIIFFQILSNHFYNRIALENLKFFLLVYTPFLWHTKNQSNSFTTHPANILSKGSCTYEGFCI